jgi:hypothetical protein
MLISEVDPGVAAKLTGTLQVSPAQPLDFITMSAPWTRVDFGC